MRPTRLTISIIVMIAGIAESQGEIAAMEL